MLPKSKRGARLVIFLIQTMARYDKDTRHHVWPHNCPLHTSGRRTQQLRVHQVDNARLSRTLPSWRSTQNDAQNTMNANSISARERKARVLLLALILFVPHTRIPWVELPAHYCCGWRDYPASPNAIVLAAWAARHRCEVIRISMG